MTKSITWQLKLGKAKVRQFKRKILKRVYGPFNINGMWYSTLGTIREIYKKHKEPDIIKVLPATTVRWVRHLLRSVNMDPSKKLTFTKAEGKRKKGRTASMRWMRW